MTSYLNKILNKRTLLAAIFCIVGIYIVFLFLAKPRIANDTASGFCSMYSWLNGNKWNYIYHLEGESIRGGFQSWWAPGQYMIPWLFIKFLGLSLGNAIILAEIVSLLLLIRVYPKVMRLLGVDDKYSYTS